MTETNSAFVSLLNYVKEMRQAQAEYFRTKSRDALIRSKNLEQAVDAQVAICEQQLTGE